MGSYPDDVAMRFNVPVFLLLQACHAFDNWVSVAALVTARAAAEASGKVFLRDYRRRDGSKAEHDGKPLTDAVIEDLNFQPILGILKREKLGRPLWNAADRLRQDGNLGAHRVIQFKKTTVNTPNAPLPQVPPNTVVSIPLFSVTRPQAHADIKAAADLMVELARRLSEQAKGL